MNHDKMARPLHYFVYTPDLPVLNESLYCKAFEVMLHYVTAGWVKLLLNWKSGKQLDKFKLR